MPRFLLTYRDRTGLLGVLILESSSLAQARLIARLEGANHGAQSCEAHELDGDSAALVPVDLIGRLLSLEEASKVMRRLERAVPKRAAAASVKRRGVVRTKSPSLILRRAQGYRPGHWGPDDYDVLDGDRTVGRIFKDANETWFWGVDFMLSHRKSYGHAESRESAMAAFKAEYERWLKEAAN